MTEFTLGFIAGAFVLAIGLYALLIWGMRP